MKFAKSREVKSPNRGTPESSGIDFHLPTITIEMREDIVAKNRNCYNRCQITEQGILLFAGKSIMIPSGIHVKIAKHQSFIAFNKSGLASRDGITVGAQVVDSDYTGEVHVNLFNLSYENKFFAVGDKLTQFLLIDVDLTEPVETTLEEITNRQTERGDGGFGSTGR